MISVTQLILLAAAFACSTAQVVTVEKCPEVEVVQDFDAGKYTGVWYEYERYPLVFELLGKCVTATYSANTDGTIGVFNQLINSITGQKQTIKGYATFVGSPTEAKLSVVFPSFLNAKGNYWVLGTDYENYSVVWSCASLGNINFLSSWVLTREAVPSEETLKKAKEVINKNKISTAYYTRTSHENCE